jgi:hypothetical protein
MNRRTLASTDARREFRNRVTTWAGRISVEPMQIQVRRMSRKWASCSSRRCVCFAETLLEQPIAFQEYVIVHELLHLRVPNHGKLFKSLLTAYLPYWRTCVPAVNRANRTKNYQV